MLSDDVKNVVFSYLTQLRVSRGSRGSAERALGRVGTDQKQVTEPKTVTNWTMQA